MCTAIHETTKYKCGHTLKSTTVVPCEDDDCGIITKEEWRGLRTDRQLSCPPCVSTDSHPRQLPSADFPCSDGTLKRTKLYEREIRGNWVNET